jgi:hypothetical protein
MMVPHMSAIHSGPTEKDFDQIPIDADHSGIVKFDNVSHPDYLILDKRISELALDAQSVIHGRFAKQRKSKPPSVELPTSEY